MLVVIKRMNPEWVEGACTLRLSVVWRPTTTRLPRLVLMLYSALRVVDCSTLTWAVPVSQQRGMHIRNSDAARLIMVGNLGSCSGVFFTALDEPTRAMKKQEFASLGGSVIPRTQWMESCASTEDTIREAKIRIITNVSDRDVSEIKLKRTDTTLDLSQKAKRAEEKRKEKIPKKLGGRAAFYAVSQGGEALARSVTGRILANGKIGHRLHLSRRLTGKVSTHRPPAAGDCGDVTDIGGIAA